MLVYSLISGVSWDFVLGKLHLNPGIQLGYLHRDNVVSGNHFYKFHGGGALAKMDL
ncbi:MAG: hypothetical protein HRT57_17340 [Crocinitomicaceae bacterium]|nr:hypothetical protein [Crocinitomicaceae bacterium]